MRDEILVTVLCTAYNHEAYLRTCLEGLVHQETDFGYEILISDDASTDGTAAIIREYEARYPERIRPFYFEENIFSRGIKGSIHVSQKADDRTLVVFDGRRNRTEDITVFVTGNV
jgi:GT2 family glycosyltransferase